MTEHRWQRTLLPPAEAVLHRAGRRRTAVDGIQITD